MSNSYYYGVVAGISVLLWAPILRNFLAQWRRRSNPVSLALAAAILLIMWWAIAGIWLITGAADVDLVVYSTAGASILTALCAHYAFHRSKLRFPDQRKKEAQ
jgi:hypothetical protein